MSALELIWQYLLFQPVARQVSSALRTLLPYSEWERVFPRNYTHQKFYRSYLNLSAWEKYL
jgi:hypothetical protein